MAHENHRNAPAGVYREMTEALRLACAARGISQTELAAKVGHAISTVNRVLNGLSLVPRGNFDGWAEAVGKRWRVELVDIKDDGEDVAAIHGCPTCICGIPDGLAVCEGTIPPPPGTPLRERLEQQIVDGYVTEGCSHRTLATRHGVSKGFVGEILRMYGFCRGEEGGAVVWPASFYEGNFSRPEFNE